MPERNSSENTEKREIKTTFTVTGFHRKYGNFSETYKMQSEAKKQKAHLENSEYQNVQITRNT